MNELSLYSFFFESITWDEGEVGFEQVPGGEDYTNRSVLAWHFYIPPLVWTIDGNSRGGGGGILETGGRGWPVVKLHSVFSSKFDNKVTFAERDKDVERLKCGGRYFCNVRST